MHFVLVLLIIIVYLGIEKILHERRLKRIPIRIHVNGTRGKSSVVRLIAEALRKAGVRTLAKTTGTNPKLIYPDGHEEMIQRRGPSRIQEQVRFIKKAAQMKVEAVVVECMAIEPQLQFASERRMIQSTLGVITNVRPDHLEVMGEDLDDIAESLSQSVPLNGNLVTGDRRYFTFFKEKATGMKTKAYLAEEVETEARENEKGSMIHQDNLAIVRKVCSLIDRIPASLAQSLIEEVQAKSRARAVKARFHDTTIHFVDAFSANDTESTRRIQSQILGKNHCPRPFIALLNNRVRQASEDALVCIFSLAGKIVRLHSVGRRWADT